MVSSFNHSQLANSGDRKNNEQISITTQVVTLEIPKGDELSQAFKKIRTLEKFIKPIAMARLAKLLKVSAKALEKSYEAWLFDQMEIATQENQNGEGR